MQSVVSRDLLADEIEALVRTGHYATEEEAIQLTPDCERCG